MAKALSMDLCERLISAVEGDVAAVAPKLFSVAPTAAGALRPSSGESTLKLGVSYRSQERRQGCERHYRDQVFLE